MHTKPSKKASLDSTGEARSMQPKFVDQSYIAKNVLKICGVIRDPMHLQQPHLLKNEGLGGGDRTFYRHRMPLKSVTHSTFKKNTGTNDAFRSVGTAQSKEQDCESETELQAQEDFARLF
jgi:hypothetical protein